MAPRGPWVLVVGALGAIASCTSAGAPNYFHGANGQSDAEKRIEELQRQLAGQAVEVARLQLALAKAEKDEKRRKEILRANLASAIPDVRSFILRELRSEPPETAIEFVDAARATLAGDAVPVVRVRAVRFLARFPQCEESVLQGAGDRDAEVRAAAATALKEFDSDRCFERVCALLEDREQSVRVAAIETLGLSKHPHAGGAILGALRRGQDDPVLERGLKALADLKHLVAIDFFVEHLTHRAESVRWASIQGLGALGDSRGGDHVRPFLGASHPRSLREIAIQTLGLLKDAKSVDEILRIARVDSEEALRTAACGALGQIGDESAAGQLLEVFIGDGAAGVRMRAWEALQSICGKDFGRQERLIRQLMRFKRKAEAEESFGRLAQGQQEGDEARARVKALERDLARFLMEEREYARALVHLKAIAPADDDPALARDLGVCYRLVGDHASALTALRQALAKAKPTDSITSELLVESVRTMNAQKEFGGALGEIERILGIAGLVLGDSARKELRDEAAVSARRLVAELRSPDEAVRSRAAKSLRANGKLAMPGLVAAGREEAQRDLRPQILEACNAIADTRVDPKAAGSDDEFGVALDQWTEWSRRHPW